MFLILMLQFQTVSLVNLFFVCVVVVVFLSKLYKRKK